MVKTRPSSQCNLSCEIHGVQDTCVLNGYYGVIWLCMFSKRVGIKTHLRNNKILITLKWNPKPPKFTGGFYSKF